MRLESGRGEDALVWALEALSDGTIVSGDSYGRVQVSQVKSNWDYIQQDSTPGSISLIASFVFVLFTICCLPPSGESILLVWM